MDKPLVLLADDNEAIRALIIAMLQADFVVHVAGDGAEAIERIRTTPYAAVLLDLLMPVVDGYAVLDFLQAERPELLQKVIVVTAALGPREIQRLLEYKVRRLITKPFEVDALYSAVRECCGLPASPFRGSLGSMLLLLATGS